jgi:hypothetical protein
MDIPHIIGYAGAALMVTTLAMRTMVPLRSFAIAANLLSVVYGYFAGVYPTLIQHAIQLPLNSWRLYEMLRLIRQVKAAGSGDLSMEWLKPFMSARGVGAGEVLFHKGDAADRMFYVVSGRLRLPDIGVEVGPGRVVGELGFLAPGRKRTQTLECTEGGDVLQIAYDRVEQMVFQNPAFGFAFLQLTSARLFLDIERLETALAASRAEVAQLRAQPTG